MARRLAVVLFNLGGPDRPESVRPFLFNLFRDPAIIGLPNPLRWLVARIFSARRAPAARAIYAEIGGRSPLLDLTREQAAALTAALGERGIEARAFVAMRYWHPMGDETAAAVKAFAPDEVVLLPLYPQYSTTTSESSIGDWLRAAKKIGLAARTRIVCCYPTEPGLIAGCAALVRSALSEIEGPARPRVLFSAHGLPKKIVAAGDPYQVQVERTAAAVAAALGIPDLDWVVCYQSRVGPLAWIGPSIEAEIERAGRDAVPVVVVPIAFVSEHSETLVELDIEYRRKAREAGVPSYRRVPALGTQPDFIAGLADLVVKAAGAEGCVCSSEGGRLCPADRGRCGHARFAAAC